MYLVIDKKLEIGQKLNKSDVAQNLYKSLSGEDIYYPKLEKTFTATYSTSPTGDVNCDLFDEEKEFLDKCFKKYYKGNYDKAIFDKIPVCDLPF